MRKGKQMASLSIGPRYRDGRAPTDRGTLIITENLGGQAGGKQKTRQVIPRLPVQKIPEKRYTFSNSTVSAMPYAN